MKALLKLSISNFFTKVSVHSREQQIEYVHSEVLNYDLNYKISLKSLVLVYINYLFQCLINSPLQRY